MTRVEKSLRADKIIEDIKNGIDKAESCKIHNLNIKQFDKELVIRCALLEYLTENKSISYISNKYGINRKSIDRRLKEMGIKAKKIINCKQDIFDVIDTEEKAYWLGFLYADGYVCAKVPSVGLGLTESDKEHVKAFGEFIGYLGTYHIVLTTKFNSKEKDGYMCQMSVQNPHLWQSLITKGVVPHKSLILTFPDENIFSNKHLIYHFIRGYCDGDGTLGVYSRNKNNPNSYLSESLMFVGTKPFLEGIQKYLGKGYLTQKPNCNLKTWRLSYSTQKANNAARLMYHNAKISLSRKQKIYDEKFVPRNREKTVNPETEIPC